MMQRYKYLLIFSLFFGTYLLNAQGTTDVEFGKNRVQYHDDFDEWLQYESPNYITYWYGKGRNIGQAVAQIAEFDFIEIQRILEHRINDKIEILVYTDITDLKQSNIGSEETFVNTNEITKTYGNKMFVYFNGDHSHLRRQIRQGTAAIYLRDMLIGANLQEMVQNAVLMNLPPWFEQGLVSYAGEFWSTDLDDQLREVILDKKFKSFERFAMDEPALAGHSLWYFLEQRFGRNVIPNLLYLTRINRSVENGFLYVLATSYEQLIKGWKGFYTALYEGEQKLFTAPSNETIAVKNKQAIPMTQLKVSPDGSKVAYVINEIGKYKVYLQEVNSKKRTLLFKGSFRNPFQATDYDYPLITWHPSGTEISILYEKKDVLYLRHTDVLTKRSREEDVPTALQRIYSIDYLDPITLVLAAQADGYSDLFFYYVNNRQFKRITTDFYDDLDAVVVNIRNKKGILFASNRQNTELEKEKLDTLLPLNNFDIFYYDLTIKNNKELIQITKTPWADERQPIAVDTTHFGFLSDETGINNRKYGYLEDYVAYIEQVVILNNGEELAIHIDSTFTNLDSTAIDSSFTRPVIKQKAINHSASNYDRNIALQHSSPRSNRLVEAIFRAKKWEVHHQVLDPTVQISPSLSYYQSKRVAYVQTTNNKPPTETSKIPIDVSKKETPTVVEVPPFFQTDFMQYEASEPSNQPKEKISVKQETISIEELPHLEALDIPNTQYVIKKETFDFHPARIVPYRLKFRTENLGVNMDNNLLFGGLDSYAGTKQGFEYPPVGILFKGTVTDLFEDYRLEGGVRVPTDFSGAEYFVLFDDRKKQIDKRYAFYYKTDRYSDLINSFITRRTETNTWLGFFEARYPLDIFTSIRASATLRTDQLNSLATDAISLNTPINSGQRIGGKLEYVYDNTYDVSMNIKNGTRYKVYAELVKRFDLDLVNGVNLDFNEGFMTVIGLDARHYQRLARYSVLAVRAAAATTFGSEKILYYLGGINNTIFSRFEENIPIPNDEDIAFRTAATNLRGFDMNIRNGNSYALVNTELRVPLLRYLFPRTQNNFLRNFQVTGFFDVGTAWQGLTPFAKENPLNTIFVSDPGHPVSVKVNYFRDPIVAGYGAGVRALLFGYFIKFDYAWGIETRIIQDPKWYLSLGMDF